MAGMTHVQYRNNLIEKIRSSYGRVITARQRIKKYKEKLAAWEGRLTDAAESLETSFGKLPEVKAGPVDMNAMRFAKSLSRQPASAKAAEEA